MTANGWLQIALFALAVILVTTPLGRYLVAVYEGRVHWLGPIERGLYRLAGVNPEEDQHWTRYAGAVLLFSAASMLPTYAVLRLQHLLHRRRPVRAHVRGDAGGRAHDEPDDRPDPESGGVLPRA
jgi:K+-transporting ATPase ATPase A chain